MSHPSKILAIPPAAATANDEIEVAFIACDEENIDEIFAAVEAGKLQDVGEDASGVHWFKRRVLRIEGCKDA